MLVVIDTTALYGLINTNDQWHKRAKTDYGIIVGQGHQIVAPRIAVIEAIGHVTRILANPAIHSGKSLCQSALKLITSVSTRLIEHTPEDFAAAERIWVEFSDWPVDLPDAIIATTAERVKAKSIWTYDKKFWQWLQQQHYNVGPFGLPAAG